jgi:hypothetical protein
MVQSKEKAFRLKSPESLLFLAGSFGVELETYGLEAGYHNFSNPLTAYT